MVNNIFNVHFPGAGWVSDSEYPLWTDAVRIPYRAVSYFEEAPLDIQIASCNSYLENKDSIDQNFKVELEKYLQERGKGLDSVSFEEIAFFQNGNYSLMCSVNWSEDGIAVLKRKDDIVVGPQFIVTYPSVNL